MCLQPVFFERRPWNALFSLVAMHVEFMVRVRGPLFWRATLAQGAGPAPVDAEKLPLRARNPNRSLQRKSGNFGICFALV